MKKLIFKYTLFLFIGLSINLNATGSIAKDELTKEVHESFNVSPGAKLGIQNKYGNITITTWNKNQIQVDVLIKVKSSNSKKAEDFLNSITIDFDSSSSYVKAKTIYPEQENNSWWSGWFGSSKNIDYEVHYTISAPEQISTTLINKYGNISQTSIDGDSDVTNKYGDIYIENITGNLSLDLGYGKASVGEVGDSKIQVKYSSIKMLSTKDIDITSKYSDVKIRISNNMVSHTKYDEYSIESIRSIKNDGKYDEFKIGDIDVFEIETKYTDVKIKNLNHKAGFETRYGSVDINSTGSMLEKINIQSKYTDYNFKINGDFHLNFEGSKTNLHVNQPFEKYHTEKDGNDLILKAYRGTKEGGVNITAYMSYGGLDIN